MIIPDDATARRIGYTAVEHGTALGFSIFTYQQPRTGLTLYGVALKTKDGEREVRQQ
jgi:hypothetical protein